MKPSVYVETTVIGHLTSRLPTDAVVAGQDVELSTLGKRDVAAENRAGVPRAGF